VRLPLVGRTRERRVLTRELNGGRNLVLTGVYGSSRTALIRALAAGIPQADFSFWGERDTRRTIRAAVARAHCAGGAGEMGSRRLVVVMDDVVHVSRLRLRFMHELLRDTRCQIVAVVAGPVRTRLMA
jgi:hypothetical protein